VSEGGLEPPRTCCITDSVMYHHSTLTRKGRPGPRSAGDMRRQRRPARSVRACDLRKRRERSAGTEPRARAGLRQPPPCTQSSGKHGDILPPLPGSSRTPAAASQTGPDDLATDLNPHETELNPHEAILPTSRQGRSGAGFPRTGRSPPAGQLVRAAPATTSPAIRGACAAQLASPAGLRARTRLRGPRRARLRSR